MGLNAFTGMGLLFGVFVTYGGWREWQKYKAIRNTPRSTVRSIAMGSVEVHGEIKADNPVSAPLTGTACACYEYEIEEYHHDDDGGDWRMVKEGRDEASATLTDDTGTVAVDLSGVSIERARHGKRIVIALMTRRKVCSAALTTSVCPGRGGSVRINACGAVSDESIKATWCTCSARHVIILAWRMARRIRDTRMS